MKRGMAIQKIVSGLLMITSPLNENNKTKVNNNALMLIGVSQCKNLSLNQLIPLYLIIQFLDKYPAIRGNATYIDTENNIVFQGTGMALMLSNKLPNGP